jgi:hypothetical protein
MDSPCVAMPEKDPGVATNSKESLVFLFQKERATCLERGQREEYTNMGL